MFPNEEKTSNNGYENQIGFQTKSADPRLKMDRLITILTIGPTRIILTGAIISLIYSKPTVIVF